MTFEETRKPHVLVVDDDDSIRELITMALEEEGFVTVHAPHGEEALKILGETKLDIILLDTRMPVMDGWEFARLYREYPCPRAPIVMLTGIDDPGNAAQEIGADSYLAKPFDLNELTEAVRQQLSRHS